MQERLHLLHHPGTNPQPFDSVIVDIIDQKLVFKESHFYPRGGGQPGDFGLVSCGTIAKKIGEVTAGDVIHHPVEIADDFEIGQSIQCSFDVVRRNDLATMHSAQHLVSAFADELWGADTVGNQIGRNETRIDLKFDDKTAFRIDSIETAVNDAITTNLSITTAEWTAHELMEDDRVRNRSFIAKILSRLPEDVNKLRVVKIDGIDICPCAGTHVNETGEIPKISVSRIKQKGAGKLRLYYELNQGN